VWGLPAGVDPVVGPPAADIWNDRAPPSADPLDDRDAWTWVEHAQAKGRVGNGDPQSGDVMGCSRVAGPGPRRA
jgi:hypothetical protein